PPSVKITAPKQGASSPSTVKVKVTASDGQSGVGSVALQRCRKGVCAAAGVDAAAPFTFSVKLKPGRYTLVAVATDRAGNTAQSGRVNVTVTSPSGKAARGPRQSTDRDQRAPAPALPR
ncbi:MAG: Ig-like domain-containing protein, partial [Chloroflexota bacterium]